MTAQVFHPWRRYFARGLDISIYEVLWSAFIALVLHMNLTERGALGNILDAFVTTAMMLALEPLWLRLFGTTPGKAVFGLKIEAPGGGRLSYGEGLVRTWGVIGAGMGYNIPIYNIIRLWKSYKLCSGREEQPWDESVSYVIKDTKRRRIALYIGAGAAVIAAIALVLLSQKLPPNRGELTVAEFAENHNYYAKLYGVNFDNAYLDKNAEWAEKELSGTMYIDISGYVKNPDYHFTVENGYVTGVSFAVEIRDNRYNRDWISSNEVNKHMLVASYAFAGAQGGAGLFSKSQSWISARILNNTFLDFSFTEAGVAFACDVEYSGYTDTSGGILFPEDGAAEGYFRLEFSANK
jgi:uncharacterized RDD family membrane protein YckC